MKVCITKNYKCLLSGREVKKGETYDGVSLIENGAVLIRYTDESPLCIGKQMYKEIV